MKQGKKPESWGSSSANGPSTGGQLSWVQKDPAPPSLLLKCALIAAFLELFFLTLFGSQEHWLAHPQKTTGLDETQFVEAEVFQFPDHAHLIDQAPQPSPPKQDTPISLKPRQSPKEASSPRTDTEEAQNQTVHGDQFDSDHGPVAIYAPPPTIPSYLRDQDLAAFVLIDFFVTAQGGVMPRLVGSSGNEELDALALESAQKWQFRPAERQHKPIDSKVRLRIIFEVN